MLKNVYCTPGQLGLRGFAYQTYRYVRARQVKKGDQSHDSHGHGVFEALLRNLGIRSVIGLSHDIEGLDGRLAIPRKRISLN